MILVVFLLCRLLHTMVVCHVKILYLFLRRWLFYCQSVGGDSMKSILQYGQAKLAVKKAKNFFTSASVAATAGDALRDGYRLKGYVKVVNGNLSYWKKEIQNEIHS